VYSRRRKISPLALGLKEARRKERGGRSREEGVVRLLPEEIRRRRANPNVAEGGSGPNES